MSLTQRLKQILLAMWNRWRHALSNIYHAGPIGFEASFDRVLVLEDEFRSGYECDSCNQTGKAVCANCGGQGRTELILQQGTVAKKCSHCNGDGKVSCPDCNGKGMLLEIPDVAKRRPTTGQIVSVGAEVRGYQLHESVAYPNFCGEVWDLSGIDTEGIERTVVLRIMKEREILCKVTGQLSLRRMKNRASQITG
jgi:hypothetical protein